MRKFIIKATEEELGSELFYVTVKSSISEAAVMEALNMAAKYAVMDPDEEDASDYDGYFEAMKEIRQSECGLTAFTMYLEQVHNFKIEPVTYKFEFEW